jgi:hypothetical protein
MAKMGEWGQGLGVNLQVNQNDKIINNFKIFNKLCPELTESK